MFLTSERLGLHEDIWKEIIYRFIYFFFYVFIVSSAVENQVLIITNIPLRVILI